jgi:cyclophilin family peptidyl-prolyl cis-trans isomerase
MSKKRKEIERRRQVSRTRRGTRPDDRHKPSRPPTKRQEEKMTMRDIWLAVGIVVLIVAAFILLYQVTVRRPATQPATTPPPVETPAPDDGTPTPEAANDSSTDTEMEAVAMSWSKPPEMQIDPSKRYEAILHTEKGDVRIELFAEEAPVTVNNFVFLAREGYYDGVTFHRVLPGFMAQTGDPTGTGSGGPGYKFRDEFHPGLNHNSVGMVSMANAGANTNGSQFFITYVPTSHLNNRHSVFGKVIEGMDAVKALTPRNPAENPAAPPGDKILSVEIIES